MFGQRKFSEEMTFEMSTLIKRGENFPGQKKKEIAKCKCLNYISNIGFQKKERSPVQMDVIVTDKRGVQRTESGCGGLLGS